jgi:hypothetical protein
LFQRSSIINGALSHLNLASNGIGKLVLPEGWSEKYGKAAVYGYTHNDGREQKEAPAGSKPEGAIAIANAIKDMGALLVLNLASNNLYAEGIELLAEALQGNQIMTELNVSGNAATWDGNKHGEMSGVIALADAIPDMRALTKLNMSDNGMSCRFPDLTKLLTEMADGHRPFVELDLSGNLLIPGEASLLMYYISALGLYLYFLYQAL